MANSRGSYAVSGERSRHAARERQAELIDAIVRLTDAFVAAADGEDEAFDSFLSEATLREAGLNEEHYDDLIKVACLALLNRSERFEIPRGVRNALVHSLLKRTADSELSSENPRKAVDAQAGYAYVPVRRLYDLLERAKSLAARTAALHLR